MQKLKHFSLIVCLSHMVYHEVIISRSKKGFAWINVVFTEELAQLYRKA